MQIMVALLKFWVPAEFSLRCRVCTIIFRSLKPLAIWINTPCDIGRQNKFFQILFFNRCEPWRAEGVGE